MSRHGDVLAGRVSQHPLAADRVRKVPAASADASRRGGQLAVAPLRVASGHHPQGRQRRAAGDAEAPYRVGEHDLVEGLHALGGQRRDHVPRRVVEAHRRDQRHPRPLGLPAVVLEHLAHERLLAGGVEVVGPGLDRGRQDRFTVQPEGPRAGDHRRAGLEQLPQRRGVVQRRVPDRDLAAEVLGEYLQLRPVASGQHHLGAAPPKLGRDQPAGVPGGSVDGDWPRLLGCFGHLRASY